MRLSAFILSFLFITLFVQPGFVNWDKIQCIPGNACVKSKTAPSGCCKKMCSAAKLPSPKKQSRPLPVNPCDNCNPFMACNACPYIPEDTQEIKLPFDEAATENVNSPDDFILPGYNAECWHPPELFSVL